MSQTAKIIAGGAVVVVLLGAIWWSQQGQQGGVTPLVAPSGSTSQQNGGNAGVSAESNSDAALNQDLSNIDAQMSGLNSDQQSVDQGLNDAPIPQGQ